MTKLHDAWLARQRARFLRPNAHLYVRPDVQRFMRPDAQRFLRPDWKRFVQPAFAPVFLSLLEGKANFNPSQPRVPKGNPGGGQWTSEGGDGGSSDDDDRGGGADFEGPGPGHNGGPPFEDPPEIPTQRPKTAQERYAIIKETAQWLARAARLGNPTGYVWAAIEVASWLDTDRAFVESYLDEPRPLEELQERALQPRLGYHKHHNVEKTSAREDGFSEELINGRDNVLLVPALKHIKITTWYQTKNERFGGLSPREYLRGKSWEERRQVGHEALIEFGVLKP